MPLALWAGGWVVGLDLRVSAFTAIVAFTPYALLPAWLIGLWSLVTRRRLLALAAGAVAAVHLVAVWPLLPGGGTDPVDGPTLRVVTANAHGNNAKARRWATELLALDADVLVVQEYSNNIAKGLRKAGAGERYPWVVSSTWPFTSESAIFSRFPLRDGDTLDIGQSAVVATADLDGLALRILSVHQDNPRSPDRWQTSFDDLTRYLDDQPGPMVVAGDFNATPFHRPLRDLLRGTLRDAHLDRDRGLATTWPAGRRFPSFALIDHVLVTDTIGVGRVAERTVAGSDHRAVLADLGLPRP